MQESQNNIQHFYAANKRHVIVGAGFCLILLFFIVAAIAIKLHQSTPPSATIAYSASGFTPTTLTLLVNNQGTDIVFVNDSDKPLDISESSSNPEVFQVGILESKNITKPKKVHVSKPGVYQFTDNKNTTQSAIIKVISTQQLKQQ